MLNSVALTIATFIVPYAQDRLGVPDNLMTWLSVIYLASSAALGSLMGRLADKAGYRSVGAVQSFLLVVFFHDRRCLAELRRRLHRLRPVFHREHDRRVHAGEHERRAVPVPRRHGPHRAGRNAPSALRRGVIPPRGDDHRPDGELPGVFYIGATIAAIALFGFAFLVREPRTGKLYEFKQTAMG